MKKTLHIFFLSILLGMTNQSLLAKEDNVVETDQVYKSKTDRYIKFVYDKLKFSKMNKLSFDAFKPAYYGYLNLIEAGKITTNATLSICDFTLSSNLKRLWVIDVKNKKVLFNSLVAHGMGTGEEYAVNFSNTEDSHQSSLGFYLTGETYQGNNGYSLKLHGVDGAYNNKAFDRGIVIHGAEYVSEQFARGNQRLGRSHGCPALPVDLAPKIIDRIENGHCLFIYHSTKNYFRTSYWLNNKVMNLPDEADLMDINMPIKSNPRYVEEKASELKNEVDEKIQSKPSGTKTNTEVIEENKSVSKQSESISKNLNKAVENIEVSDKHGSQTVIIKKPAYKTATDETEQKAVRQILLVNINSQTGIADTTYLK